jgi:hypothetical protein
MQGKNNENSGITLSMPDDTSMDDSGRKRWMSKADFMERIIKHQADAGLTQELQELVSDTTDDIRDP